MKRIHQSFRIVFVVLIALTIAFVLLQTLELFSNDTPTHFKLVILVITSVDFQEKFISQSETWMKKLDGKEVYVIVVSDGKIASHASELTVIVKPESSKTGIENAQTRFLHGIEWLMTQKHNFDYFLVVDDDVTLFKTEVD